MNRMFLICLLFIMIGCESDRPFSRIEPSAALSEAKETIVPAKASKDMNRLLQNKPSTLRIQVKGEVSLKAASLLLDKIWNLLKQSKPVEPGAVYNDQNYDLNESDITLSFSDYKPIILNTKYHYFRFAGDTVFYVMPGNPYKWGHLAKENNANGSEYSGFTEKILSQQVVDMDGNGVKEKISLVYNGDLELRINELSEIVYANLEDSDANVYTIMAQKPMISIESPSIGTHKKMIVSIVWATNRIGSTVEMWIYEYRNEQIKRIWQLADERPKTVTAYKGNRDITVEITDYNLKQKLMISENDYKRIHNTLSQDVLIEDSLIGLGTTTEYLLKDLDGDGHSELMTKRITYLEDSAFYFETLYTFFKLTDKKLIPTKAFFVDGIKQTLVEQLLKGEQIVLDPKNSLISYLIETGFTFDQIKKSYQEMKDEGLIIKGLGNQYRLSSG